MPLSDADKALHRRMAVDLFNRTWQLLDRAERSPGDVDEMIHSAHASRLHWGQAGTPENWLIGEWQVARVYSVLGRFEPAKFHAERALALAEQYGIQGFNRACCFEVLARAWSLQDKDRSREYLNRAAGMAEGIIDPDERKVLEEDLASVRSALDA